MRPFFVLSLTRGSLLSAAVLLGACAFPFPGLTKSTLKGKHPDGTPRYSVSVDAQGRKHGLERWWHENRQLQLEATWVGGVRNGVYRAWYPDGTPWYEGWDSLGVPVDTLRVWHPNGKLQSLTVHERGAPASLETWDTAGYTPAQRAQLDAEEAERAEARRRADSVNVAQASRHAALALWVPRVRATVETWWKLPESQKRVARRAVARLRVAPDGRLLEVTWLEKSGSPGFDRRAAQALAKIRKLPPPPPELGTEPLTLRYEFATSGVGEARKRLKSREGEE